MGLLSRVGIGSATVDTILERDTVRPGESVEAHIEIEGGSDDQDVEELELAVATAYQVPDGDDDVSYRTAEISEMELTDGFTIEAGEERTMDVPPIEIPVTTPATIDRTRVWIRTGLEIDWSVDPTDEDRLNVEPGPYLAALLEAIEDLGFRFEMADNVRSSFGPHEFAQFFEYEEYGGTEWDGLDDIEFFAAPAEDHLSVQVDVEASGFSLFGGDEQRATFTVRSTDPSEVQSTVRSVIDENLG
jgi:sporulation-control protein